LPLGDYLLGTLRFVWNTNENDHVFTPYFILLPFAIIFRHRPHLINLNINAFFVGFFLVNCQRKNDNARPYHPPHKSKWTRKLTMYMIAK
jgi:hypothetical protein